MPAMVSAINFFFFFPILGRCGDCRKWVVEAGGCGVVGQRASGAGAHS